MKRLSSVSSTFIGGSAESNATRDMAHVLIVCSVHHEAGRATAGELHWLLEQLRPDVIFLELSPANFSAFLDGSFGTLESAAVMHYRKSNEVEVVPVDMDLEAAELKPKIDEMFERLEGASPRYCQLHSLSRQHLERGGFAYLNSSVGARIQVALRREIQATVEAAGDSTLTDLHALWTRTNDLRESAMISGVERYASSTSFKKGVLIVGAAHQQPLFEKIKSRCSDGANTVTWEFEWGLPSITPGLSSVKL
ncbi:MAG: hypothetical protein QM696_00265 [Steroidobacteraceae bacterium]